MQDIGTHLARFDLALIDFGDAVYGPVLADVAIAGAYMVLDTDTPIENLAEFLRGYTSVSPLSQDEVAALWPLVLTRLAVSVVNSAMMKRDRPDDPYVVISETPAWRLLDNLALYDPGNTRLDAVLFDAEGRTYLGALNNVPHVGHCHPDVVRAVSRQIARLNTNTRYLNQGLADYAEALIRRLPDQLDTCFFVNSGSEANEVALLPTSPLT